MGVLPARRRGLPAVRLAREAGSLGGTPAVYNAANEVCVAAFLAGEMRFTDIVSTIERVLGAHDVRSTEQELTVDDVLAADMGAPGGRRASRRVNRRAVVNPR